MQLARAGDQPIAQIAKDLGISESCLRNGIKRDEIETGDREGLTAAERAELVALRRRTRALETENEILKRAAAFFAKENVLPK
ncbi:MAG: transposase [Burkholderiales bacterium]